MRKWIKREGKIMADKKGQVTLFVIIALVLVGGIITFFAVRDRFGISSIPEEFAPVYDYYSSCITDASRAGLDLAGSQGGHIYLDDYIPGSEYAPSSSH